MKDAREALTRLAFMALVAGVGLALVARSQENFAMTSAQCYFDQSCDVTPTVVAARRLLGVGWTVVGAAAVLAGLAVSSRKPRWSRPVVLALLGVALIVSGVTGKAALLAGYVPAPTSGCQLDRTCAVDPSWTSSSPTYDALLLLPIAGCALVTISLVALLRRPVPSEGHGRRARRSSARRLRSR